LVSVDDDLVEKPDRDLLRRRPREAGFTLTELLIAVTIIGILTGIMLPNLLERYHKARLARCMVELRGIQTGLYMASEPGLAFPDAASFWSTVFPAARPGPYFYLADAEDPNAGHGNDLDGYDEQNPGGAPRTAKDIKFVLLCQHYHANLCRYVYIEDEGPPQLAMDGDDPHYDIFVKWEDGRTPGGKPGGGKKDTK
jgi:prepilin-type N-terminal cleavage/methylation domain-containing protein